MHINSLPDATRSLLLSISQHCDGIDEFLLIGGTALALQIAHRLSEDLDFAFPEKKLDRTKIRLITEQLQKLGKVVIYNNPPEAIEDAVNHGIEIEDYHQDYLVDDVKLTFFAFGDYDLDRELIRGGLVASSKLRFVNVADSQTLFDSKCIALTDRIKSRDLYDLWWLTRDGSTCGSTQSIFETIQKYRPSLQYEHVRHRLLDWKIGATDESFAPLINHSVTVESIRNDFRAEVNALESRMAAALAAKHDAE